MKQLVIKKIEPSKKIPQEKAAQVLKEKTNSETVGIVNWEDFAYKPEVQFWTGHTGNEVWICFEVKEKNIRALETEINGNVHKDSCVEFFVSFDGVNYYNIEMNCIGTVHFAFGPDRENRKFVPSEFIHKIRLFSSLGNDPFSEIKGNFIWQITACFPVECFCFNNFKTFDNRKAKANFYKCGDETSEPHFITWQPVKTEGPDYHQPNFFGEIWFE